MIIICRLLRPFPDAGGTDLLSHNHGDDGFLIEGFLKNI